jgi:hypothetical protein
VVAELIRWRGHCHRWLARIPLGVGDSRLVAHSADYEAPVELDQAAHRRLGLVNGAGHRCWFAGWLRSRVLDGIGQNYRVAAGF